MDSPEKSGEQLDIEMNIETEEEYVRPIIVFEPDSGLADNVEQYPNALSPEPPNPTFTNVFEKLEAFTFPPYAKQYPSYT